ncbi:NAD-dependent epimerase/dehydratase family protein [Phaeobacter sp. PT47_59]|uniref:NAD-dependent epimerase/dehydratase family protein n=1 Tax=Phaeobacter sp. PT47_59 TaxID=3029979 RepID=UPI00238030E1|nr:NAD-dependent epimerase/dehydratase family protein [Phaeobacter sp. PT47_59]MDE4175250.1 NAD-dependent epimerase/dehydratase family protein [Phaeobacter sp. PT47_59]
MKVLVIGGCGFIGSHVVDMLLAKGEVVRVLDRRAEQFRAPLPDVEYVMCDLADTAQIYEALNGVDAVVHLASTTVPATSNLDPEADITGNLIAMVRLLEVMRQAGVRKMVYLSSGGTVYGVPQSDPMNEEHPLNPISSYGIVKVAIENYLFMEHKLHGLDYVSLRASNPYGPRQGHTGIQGLIGTHLWRLARKEQIEVWGDGSVVRDFIHVRDLAELCHRALTSGASGNFNAGSGDGASVADVVQKICDTVGGDVTPVYKPGRNFDVPRVVLDVGKAERELGWQKTIDLEQGIAETWTWVQEQVR